MPAEELFRETELCGLRTEGRRGLPYTLFTFLTGGFSFSPDSLTLIGVLFFTRLLAISVEEASLMVIRFFVLLVV